MKETMKNMNAIKEYGKELGLDSKKVEEWVEFSNQHPQILISLIKSRMTKGDNTFLERTKNAEVKKKVYRSYSKQTV